MSDSTNQRHPRRTTAIIVVVLVLVIAAVAAIGVLTAASARPSAAPTTGASTPSTSIEPSSPTTTSPSATRSVKPSKAFTPTPAATASKPQPTRTAALSSSAPITKSLSAAVTRMEAVQGTASGPGEIAGPSVRFTVTIRNTTGKTVDLSNTVVNAYAGTDSAPVVQLQGPGAENFPSSVANGRTAVGVFVFNIPTAVRKHVEVTVDTSVLNPVVAFRGAAPR